MDQIVWNLVYIGLFVLLIAGASPVRPLSGFNEDYLSRDSTGCLRGFFAVVVAMGHMKENTGGVLCCLL